jgi:hypothetical protein
MLKRVGMVLAFALAALISPVYATDCTTKLNEVHVESDGRILVLFGVNGTYHCLENASSSVGKAWLAIALQAVSLQSFVMVRYASNLCSTNDYSTFATAVRLFKPE